MTTHPVYVGGARKRLVGQAHVRIELENTIDRTLVNRGLAPEASSHR